MIQALAEPLEKTLSHKLSINQHKEIEDLLEQGELKQEDIARKVGCAQSVVSRVKKDSSECGGEQSLTNPAVSLEIEKEAVRVLRQIYKRITPTTEKEELRAFGATFSEFFKVARLLSGESTQNIATKNLSTLIVQIDDEARGKGVKTKKERGGDTPGGDSGGEVSGE